MIGLLFGLVITVLILGFFYWLVGLCPLPAPFGQILRALIILIFVIYIIYILMALLPSMHMPALSR